MLLESHFLRSDYNKDAMREELLYRSKIFGYVKLSQLQLHKMRLEYLESVSSKII